MPLGLTVATDRIYNAFLSEERTKALLHGHSFTGNAMACAAACASLDLFEQEHTKKNIQRITEKHRTFRNGIAGHSAVKEVRMLGTILAVEIETGEGNTYFSSIRDEAYNFFLDNGMLCRPLGNIIFLNPPYCITDTQLEHCYDVFRSFITKVGERS